MVRGKEKEIVGIWGQEGGWNSAIRGGGSGVVGGKAIWEGKMVKNKRGMKRASEERK